MTTRLGTRGFVTVSTEEALMFDSVLEWGDAVRCGTLWLTYDRRPRDDETPNWTCNGYVMARLIALGLVVLVDDHGRALATVGRGK